MKIINIKSAVFHKEIYKNKDSLSKITASTIGGLWLAILALNFIPTSQRSYVYVEMD